MKNTIFEVKDLVDKLSRRCDPAVNLEAYPSESAIIPQDRRGLENTKEMVKATGTEGGVSNICPVSVPEWQGMWEARGQAVCKGVTAAVF